MIAWLIETEAKDINGNKIDVTNSANVENINNIYDINTFIWTMETLSDTGAPMRYAAKRFENAIFRHDVAFSRTSLYIKI